MSHTAPKVPLQATVTMALLAFCPICAGYIYYGGSQQQRNLASTYDRGSALVNSDIALERAQVCGLLFKPNGIDLLPSLVGRTFQPKPGTNRNDWAGTFVCAADGTTAIVGINHLSETPSPTLVQLAKVKPEDLPAFRQVLIDRALVSESELNAMRLNRSEKQATPPADPPSEHPAEHPAEPPADPPSDPPSEPSPSDRNLAKQYDSKEI